MAMNTGVLPTSNMPASNVPNAGIPSATWQMLSNQARMDPLPKNIDAVFDVAKWNTCGG